MAKFACLGAECPDTCCRGWEMPVDAAQRARYVAQAPELLDIIDPEAGVLRREGDDRHCTRLREGICGVHADYGTDFLGDACYFYPRLWHNVGGEMRMTGAMSCPEIVRLVMQELDPFAQMPATADRLPAHRRDRVPEGWSAQAVDAVHAHALALAADAQVSPEAAMLRLLALAESLARSTPENWREQWEIAVAQAPAPQRKEGDSHTLYYALALTEAFGDPGISKGLAGIFQQMEQALACRFERASRDLQFVAHSKGVQARLWQRWRMDAQAALAPMLRRWIQAQLSITLFPFGGFHELTIAERGAVLVQRFATVRLALMCAVPPNGVAPDEASVMQVMQGIARFMDHLADAKLTMMIHRDAGWADPARLRGLIAGESPEDFSPR